MPNALRKRVQSTLAAQWVIRVPVLQRQAPAELAASVIQTLLKSSELSTTRISAVDFCSGGGGPTPVIERIVNASRRANGQQPIDFYLSDLHPHLEDWIALADSSVHLHFIPQSIDAARPLPRRLNMEPHSKQPRGARDGEKMFRLFFASFHHFNDKLAKEILASSLEESEGFAIVELVDRRVSSMLTNFEEAFVVMLLPLIYFIHDPIHLFFTYVIPILPFVLVWDGLISSLRVRTFDELMQLIDSATGRTNTEMRAWWRRRHPNEHRAVDRAGWRFEGGRYLHTIPNGHLAWFIGYRRS